MSALEGEPSLKIALLGGSKVESAGNDGDNPVWNSERPIEFL